MSYNRNFMKQNKLFIVSGFIALTIFACNNNGKENKFLSAESFASADSCNDNEGNNNVLSTDTCKINEKEFIGLNTEIFVYSDSCKYADLFVKAELPLDANPVSVTIRKGVISLIKKALTRPIKPVYDGDTNNAQEMLKFYCEELYKDYVKDSRNMVESEDSALITQWEYLMNVKIDQETNDYIVFLFYEYGYWGGIHGENFGDGPVLFSKKNGTFISTILDGRNHISAAIDISNYSAIQPLLKEGFETYYSGKSGVPIVDLGEFLDDTVRRLPDYLLPIGDSILFVYRRHEHVAYGNGNPTFKFPVSKVKPFLTPQAIKVFGIKN